MPKSRFARNQRWPILKAGGNDLEKNFDSGVFEPGKARYMATVGSGNLLFLDGAGQKLVRLHTRNMTLSLAAADLPAGYSPAGSYPPIEFPWPMAVGSNGDINLATLNRGMIKLQKK